MILFVPTLLIASLTIFGLMRVLPGDVAAVIAGTADSEAGAQAEELEIIREQLGLKRPPAHSVRAGGSGAWSRQLWR